MRSCGNEAERCRYRRRDEGRTTIQASFVFVPLNIIALAAIAAGTAFLHHGHIMMFIADVHQRVAKGSDGRLRGARIDRESSRLRLTFGGAGAHSYEVSVHRKTRSVDVALKLHGAAAENERLQGLLAAAAEEIRAQLGRGVELELLPAHRARLVRMRKLSEGDWSPKRDLTPSIVADTADLLLRFIRVLEPIVRKPPTATPRG